MSENKKSVEQIEQERLTRRQALRKFGFGAGMSAIMLLGADDLARMVGDRMRQTEIDREATDQVAKELRGVGIAFADGDDPLPGNGGSDSLVCSSQGCVDPDQCNTHHYSWLKCPKCGSFGNCVYEQFNCSEQVPLV